MALDATASPFDIKRLTSSTPGQSPPGPAAASPMTPPLPSAGSLDSVVKRRLDSGEAMADQLHKGVESAHSKISYIADRAIEARDAIKTHERKLDDHKETLERHENRIEEVNEEASRRANGIAEHVNAKIVPALEKHERDIHEHNSEDLEFREQVKQLQQHSDEAHATVAAMQREVSQMQSDFQSIASGVQRDGTATKKAIDVMMKAEGAIDGVSKRIALLEMRFNAISRAAASFKQLEARVSALEQRT